MPISFGLRRPAENTSFALRAFADAVDALSSWTRAPSGVDGPSSFQSSDAGPREPRCARCSFKRSWRRAEEGLTNVGVPLSGVPAERPTCQCVSFTIGLGSGTNCIAEVASVWHVLGIDLSTMIFPDSFVAGYTCCVCPSRGKATGALGDLIALEMRRRI